MSYYMGDYRGDYYQGDPGFLSGLGSIFGKVASFIPGVGPIVSGVKGLIGGGSKAGAGMALAKLPGAAAISRSGVGRAISRHPVLTAAGAAGTIGALGGIGAAHLMGAGGACPKGFHPSRTKRILGKCVRSRRMRVTNPRALRRALRRAYGFEKICMRTVHLLHPRKRARFGGFKKHRRK